MSIPDFLKDQQKKTNKETPKGDFREKCLRLLGEIKELNNERHSELMKVFRSRYDKINIQKKKILGFYAQLVNELNQLKESAGIQIRKTTKRVAGHHTFKEAQEVVKKVEREAKQIKKTTKRLVNNVTKKVEETKEEIEKNIKKAVQKEEQKKKATKAKKKVSKKVAKKKTTKTKKKTAKKAASKKVAKKKTAKKKSPKKTAKKKTKKKKR